MISSIFDLLFIITAIFMNVLVIAIFLVRFKGKENVEQVIGYMVLACAIPLIIVLINYIIIGMALWIIIYLIIILSYLVVEMLLDYILKIEFRKNPKIVGPYVLLYYIAYWGLLAISFVIDLAIGFIVFGVFMANVVVTIITHKKDKAKMYKTE